MHSSDWDWDWDGPAPAAAGGAGWHSPVAASRA